MNSGGDEHPALAADEESAVIVAHVEGLEERSGNHRQLHRHPDGEEPMAASKPQHLSFGSRLLFFEEHIGSERNL